MSPDRIGAVALRYFYLLRGNPTRILPLFIWVAIDIILWGFITRYLNRVSGSGLDFVPQFLGAMLLWGFFIRVLQGVTMVFMEDVWSRNFLNIFASPLSVPEYLTGLILSSIATSAVGLVVMFSLASLAFGLSFFALGLVVIPFLLTLFLFGIAIGILGCAVMLRFGPPAEWFVWAIPAIISPFAGVFYPVSVLPGWMRAMAWCLPPSYVFEGLRAVLAGQGTSAFLGLGLLLAIGFILLACVLFVRVYRHALRSGLIARYSAESLS